MVCEVKSLCIKKINDPYELELHFNKWKGKDNVINLVIKKKVGSSIGLKFSKLEWISLPSKARNHEFCKCPSKKKPGEIKRTMTYEINLQIITLIGIRA